MSRRALLGLILLGGCAPLREVRVPAWPGEVRHGRQEQEREHGHDPRLSDEALPLQVDEVPERTRPLFELGDPFLGSGPLQQGIELPTGAVLQPSLLVYGTSRVAGAAVDHGSVNTSEIAATVDLYANLQLSGTERVLVGLRPLDQVWRFTSYVFEPSSAEGWQDETNADVTTLFFEGDLGELFPGLDPEDTSAWDYGLAVGRQPLTLQEGLLLDDRVDAFGLTRNTLRPSSFSNLRLTGLFVWDEIHRDDGSEDRSAKLFGLAAEGDRGKSTLSLDLLYLTDTAGATDAAFAGAGAVQRIGHWNTAFHAAGSFPVHGETPETGRGGVFLAQVSRNLPDSEDLLYVNGYYGLEEFSSASRAPELGGPLGRVGILFAAVGLGSYPAAVSNDPSDSFGGALGCQWFTGDMRSQLVLEVGGREDTRSEKGELACAARFLRAFGKHIVFRVDGFYGTREDDSPTSGIRTELMLKL